MNKRLCDLRLLMDEHNAAACIISSFDPHLSEYPADCWKLREYFSGFTGSAGTLVVMSDEAMLWTDSRYFLHAELELQGTEILLQREGEAGVFPFYQYLANKLTSESSVVIDPLAMSASLFEQINNAFSLRGIKLVELPEFALSLWEDRPALPQSELFVHDKKYAGITVSEKLELLRFQMKEKQTDTYIICALDEIAWLYNIRASDISFNPVCIAYAIVTLEQAYLFVDSAKISEDLIRYFSACNVSLNSYESFYTYISKINATSILIDKTKVNAAIYLSVKAGNNIVVCNSLISRLKAVKNSVEIDGVRLAMRKDGIALLRFQRWLESCLSVSECITEIDVADALLHFRAEQERFFSESFSSIVAYAAHAAIVHYRADENSNVRLQKKGLLLVDSGGQYLHGTTDITRTFALGELSFEQKKHYTLVLKGHIALATAVFPEGTCGYQLDALARQFLWAEGLNYGHGTGHGVGCFLNVHEGPQGIRPDANRTALEPGMILSNEPGFYEEGSHGIRLENLILVKKDMSKNGFLHFETLTLFPFDLRSVLIELLTPFELEWLNEYHQSVFQALSPYISDEERDWLRLKCLPITN